MRTWVVRSCVSLVALAAVLFIGGACTLLFGAWTVLLGTPSIDETTPTWVRLVPFIISVGWFAMGACCLRVVHAIHVNEHGDVTLERVVRSTAIAARHIRALEGTYSRGYDGSTVWTLRIRYGVRGQIELSEFEGVSHFRDTVLAHHPDVQEGRRAFAMAHL